MQTAITTQNGGTAKDFYWGISGSTLKIIAIISMVIDHTGAVILKRFLLQETVFVLSNTLYSILYTTYYVFRFIGRISFPIFCFLLVQGFMHTHSLKKYLCRLFIFALISEVPFDFALSGTYFDWGCQNVFFTLFFGILAIAGIRIAEKKRDWNVFLKALFNLLVVGICVGIVILLKTDYDMLGVLTIVVLYLFRQKKTLSVVFGCVILMEISALISIIPIHYYNGKRGKNIKWFFYLFYPLHLILLYGIVYLLGLGQIT